MTEEIGSISNRSGAAICRMFRSAAQPRKAGYRLHRHAFAELSLILEGEGLYAYGGAVHPIRPGDVFLFAANGQHCITDIGPGGMVLLNLHVSPRFLWVGDDPAASRLTAAFSCVPDNRMDACSPLCESVRTGLLAVREEFAKAERDYELAVRARLMLVLLEILRAFPQQEKSACRVSSDSLRRVECAIEYMDAHFSEPLTLAAIAAQAGVTREYFSTLFHTCYGISPWEYLILRRIECAKERLRTTDDTVLAVALFSGFNNTANFNRLFRNYTGVTPRQYRSF